MNTNNINTTKHFGSLIKMSTFIILVFGAVACGSDFLVDPAGACVTCTSSVATGSISVQACADGEGNITTVTNGDQSTAVVTDNFSLNDFQVAQEGSGASCQ